MIETITIPLSEYSRLQQADAMLDALFAAGVEDWEGYDEAMEMLDEEE